jgi:2-dehydro-3-deoxyglucarate aldolase
MTSLKTKLQANELCVAGWIMIGHPAIGEIMARAGFDAVVVDLEHSAMGIQQAEDIIRAVETGGGQALVRLTNNDENLIKRVMDGGATGVIVPLVRTAEEAQAAVKALYYPPRGTRGVGLARAQKYGADFAGYQKWLKDEAVCIVQIEHIDAVENAHDILSVDGVDGYILGPYDLSASMGKPGHFEDEDFKAAMAEVRRVGDELGKPGGLHVVEPDEAKLQECVDQGSKFIAYSIDTRMIDVASRSAVGLVKGQR